MGRKVKFPFYDCWYIFTSVCSSEEFPLNFNVKKTCWNIFLNSFLCPPTYSLEKVWFTFASQVWDSQFHFIFLMQEFSVCQLMVKPPWKILWGQSCALTLSKWVWLLRVPLFIYVLCIIPCFLVCHLLLECLYSAVYNNHIQIPAWESYSRDLSHELPASHSRWYISHLATW